ncbi:MAG TPA: hypothetical protein VM389_05360 [Phycisphaerae bacterium]|nr:hypothetical protein [Phycisphaerae bacterium]
MKWSKKPNRLRELDGQDELYEDDPDEQERQKRNSGVRRHHVERREKGEDSEQ